MPANKREDKMDFPGCMLNLANGTSIFISPEDKISSEVISFFQKSCKLQKIFVKKKSDFLITVKKDFCGRDNLREGKDIFDINSSEKILRLDQEKLARFKNRDGTLFKHEDENLTYLSEEEWMWRQLSRLSSVIGSCNFSSGGFLVHSGLVKYTDRDSANKEKGILLAGASGAGKTTASKMFKPPWFSLSDDLTLIVRNRTGKYFAHPFPTWSRFLGKKESVSKDSWEVEKYTPLTSVIFLDRRTNNGLTPMGKGESLSLITELVKQANNYFVLGLDRKFIPEFNRNFFINVYNMVKVIDCYSYDLKIDNSFWKEVEEDPEITG